MRIIISDEDFDSKTFRTTSALLFEECIFYLGDYASNYQNHILEDIVVELLLEKASILGEAYQYARDSLEMMISVFDAQYI